jgi:hypothetical protein
MVFKTLIAASALLFLSSSVSIAETATKDTEAVVAQSDELEALDTLIYSVRLRMAFGQSVWTADLDTALDVNPLKLRYIAEPSCRVPFVQMYLRDAVSGMWVKTRRDIDVDRHDLSSFDGIRFDIDQPYLLSQTCEFNVFGLVTSPSPGDPDNNDIWGAGVLAGGAEYNGGFAQNLEVAISAAQRVRGFRLSVPEFCKDLEILEAGTVTEGVFEPATVVDVRKNIFKVANGAVRSSLVRFTINGPFDSRCFIPLYTYDVN